MGNLTLECDENSPVLWKDVSLENLILAFILTGDEFSKKKIIKFIKKI